MTSTQPAIPQIKQHGFVLIACLVILLVLTVLGINAMSTANLEERMASNSQSMLAMFQHAESGISAALEDNNAMSTAGQGGASVQLTHNLGHDSVTTDVVPPGGTEKTNLIGSSLCLSGYPVEVIATAESAGTGARSRLVQGAAVKGAGEC